MNYVLRLTCTLAVLFSLAASSHGQSRKKQILQLEARLDSMQRVLALDRSFREQSIQDLQSSNEISKSKLSDHAAESDKLEKRITALEKEISVQEKEIESQNKALRECQNTNNALTSEAESLRNIPPTVLPEFENERLCLVRKKWVYPNDKNKTNELVFYYDGTFSSWGEIYDLKAEGTWEFLNSTDIRITLSWNSMGMKNFQYDVSLNNCKTLLNGSTLYKQSSY